MARLPPSAAIFSPSVARLATSAAKDWSYVDRWLGSKFHSGTPPPFERNAETLKTLVTLATFNESVDEDCDAMISVKTLVLKALSKGANTKAQEITTPDLTRVDDARQSPAAVAGRILAAVEDVLPREGHAALDSLIQVSVELGDICSEPADLGHGVTALHARLCQLEQAASSNNALKAHVEEISSSATTLLRELDHDQYRPPTDLARLNLEMQRKVKVRAEGLQDTRDKTEGLAVLPDVTIARLQEIEKTYVGLLARSKDLDSKIRAFQGLAPNKDLARRQLEELRMELHIVAQERDAVFEDLVDKASPEKKSA